MKQCCQQLINGANSNKFFLGFPISHDAQDKDKDKDQCHHDCARQTSSKVRGG
jgi:hypothetical protein